MFSFALDFGRHKLAEWIHICLSVSIRGLSELLFTYFTTSRHYWLTGTLSSKYIKYIMVEYMMMMMMMLLLMLMMLMMMLMMMLIMMMMILLLLLMMMMIGINQPAIRMIIWISVNSLKLMFWMLVLYGESLKEVINNRPFSKMASDQGRTGNWGYGCRYIYTIFIPIPFLSYFSVHFITFDLWILWCCHFWQHFWQQCHTP